MTDQVDAAVSFKVGIPCNPKAIQLVGLKADCFDHSLSVVRHEEGYVKEDLDTAA